MRAFLTSLVLFTLLSSLLLSFILMLQSKLRALERAELEILMIRDLFEDELEVKRAFNRCLSIKEREWCLSKLFSMKKNFYATCDISSVISDLNFSNSRMISSFELKQCEHGARERLFYVARREWGESVCVLR